MQALLSRDNGEALDYLIGVTDACIRPLKPDLLAKLNSFDVPPVEAAINESWTLLKNGLLHLKQGAPGLAPGSVAGALKKASLYSSSLLISLQVKAPDFGNLVAPAAAANSGNEWALSSIRGIIDTSTADLASNRKNIHQAIQNNNFVSAFGFTEFNQHDLRQIENAASLFGIRDNIRYIKDPEVREEVTNLFNTRLVCHLQETMDDRPEGKVKEALRALFQKAALQPGFAPVELISSKKVNEVRKHAIGSFNLLAGVYTDVCSQMKKSVERVPVIPEKKRGKDRRI